MKRSEGVPVWVLVRHSEASSWNLGSFEETLYSLLCIFSQAQERAVEYKEVVGRGGRLDTELNRVAQRERLDHSQTSRENLKPDLLGESVNR